MQPAEIRYEKVKLTDLKSYPGNARRGNITAIRESLRSHGQYRPLVVQESTGYILAGNHTAEAAREEGWVEVDVGVIDVDDDQAKRIVLVDNRTNDLAGYDDMALSELLAELPDFDGTGFTDQDYNELLASLTPGGFFTRSELELVTKVPSQSITQPGDVVIMGAHTLYCMDALEFDPPTEFADMIWTDPPYLIGYQETSSYMRDDGKQIENEGLSGVDAKAFRWQTAQLIHKSLRPGASYYLHMPPGVDQAHWIYEMQAADLEPRQVLQWIKDQFTLTRHDYHYRSEPILYGWKKGAAHYFSGDRTQDNVWEFKRPKRSKDHPTIKPYELAMKAIELSSRQGDTVFDPFTGSGTVLVACLQTGRKAMMIELDGRYCDVIIERYERLTGEKAERKE